MLKYQYKQIVIFKSNFFTTNKQLIQNEPFLSRKQESSETRTIIWKNGFNFDNRAKAPLFIFLQLLLWPIFFEVPNQLFLELKKMFSKMKKFITLKLSLCLNLN